MHISDTTIDSLKDKLSRRARKCINLSKPYLSKGEFYIAGSCIASDTIRDVDVYPVQGSDFIIPSGKSVKIITKTPNAKTIEAAIPTNPPVQFCTYNKPSLSALVDSFDFSHVQAGVYIKDSSVESVYFSENYLLYRLTSIVSFHGSEYPLSSLFRLLKYFESLKK